jgi:hypothetical protein
VRREKKGRRKGEEREKKGRNKRPILSFADS